MGDGRAFGHATHRHKTCEVVVGRRQGDVGVAVVGFLNAACQSHRQSFRCDVGRRATRGCHTVVVRISPAQAHTRHADVHRGHIAVGVRHVFVHKVSGAVDREHIAIHIAIGRGQASGHSSVHQAVVLFAYAGVNHGQGACSNVGCCAARGHHGVVVGVGAAQRHTAHADCFGRAHVFIDKVGGAIDGQFIGGTAHAQAIVGGGYGGECATVVHAVHARVGHAQGTWGDVGGGGSRGQHVVVARIHRVGAYGVAQAHTCDADGFAARHVFIGVTGSPVDDEVIAQHTVVGGGHTGGGACVVHLVYTAVRNGQVAGRDVGCGRARS